MIIFNGLKYAKNDKEMINSLFDGTGTCAGFYKKIKAGYQIFNLQHEIFAFLQTINGFAVSAIMHDGKTRYSFGLDEKSEKLLGLDQVRYSDQSTLICGITEKLNS